MFPMTKIYLVVSKQQLFANKIISILFFFNQKLILFKLFFGTAKIISCRNPKIFHTTHERLKKKMKYTIERIFFFDFLLQFL